MFQSVKVGAHQYQLHYVDVVPNLPEDAVEAERYTGLCNPIQGEIWVTTGRSNTMMAETLLHEITHAVSADRSLDLSEEQVNGIAAGLLDVIVSNPEMFGRQFMEQFE